mgnify:CR=1 FL=1
MMQKAMVARCVLPHNLEFLIGIEILKFEYITKKVNWSRLYALGFNRKWVQQLFKSSHKFSLSYYTLIFSSHKGGFTTLTLASFAQDSDVKVTF